MVASDRQHRWHSHPKKNYMASIASKLTQTASTPTRTRKKPDAAMVTMERLAAQYHQYNVAANAAKRAAEKAREELYTAMKVANVDSFVTKAESEVGSSVLIEAKVKATVRRVIDVEALAKFVSPEVFIKVVSATQKAVVDQCGSDLALRCSREEQGDENVSVAVVK